MAGAFSLRGMRIVSPVDGMSAATAYIEGFVAVHMSSAPLESRNVTLNGLDLIRFYSNAACPVTTLQRRY